MAAKASRCSQRRLTRRTTVKSAFVESLASFPFWLWSRLSKPYLRLWLLCMESEAQGINSDGKEVLSLSTGTARVMEMSWIHPNGKLRWMDTAWAPTLAGSRRGQRQTCQFSQLMLEFLRELASEDCNSPLVLFEQFINSLINQACQQTHMHVFCSAPSGSQESAIPAS